MKTKEAPKPEKSENATLGSQLSVARLRHGWTVEEAAARTRLHANVIRNLEADRFDKLPSLSAHLRRAHAGVQLDAEAEQRLDIARCRVCEVYYRSGSLAKHQCRPARRPARSLTASLAAQLARNPLMLLLCLCAQLLPTWIGFGAPQRETAAGSWCRSSPPCWGMKCTAALQNSMLKQSGSAGASIFLLSSVPARRHSSSQARPRRPVWSSCEAQL